VRRLVAAGIDHLVVAAPASRVAEFSSLLRPVTGELPCVVVPGGRTRRESVSACLRELPNEVTSVLVHDAARPLVPAAVVRRVLDALTSGAEAVVPVLPLDDTIKEVAGDRVARTVDRLALRAVQTPQGFVRDALVRAHAEWSGADEPTDDAAMVEALGVPVSVVDGVPEGFKVTGPLDLRLAEVVLAAQA
jgi:2-C-methyl-D-erythritol 4-phosphate cytidylyltransferase